MGVPEMEERNELVPGFYKIRNTPPTLNTQAPLYLVATDEESSGDMSAEYIGMIVGICVAVVVLVIQGIVFYRFYQRRKNREAIQNGHDGHFEQEYPFAGAQNPSFVTDGSTEMAEKDRHNMPYQFSSTVLFLDQGNIDEDTLKQLKSHETGYTSDSGVSQISVIAMEASDGTFKEIHSNAAKRDVDDDDTETQF